MSELNIIPLKKDTSSVLLLPFPVLARIMYETFKSNDFELGLILPMLYTCKYVYYTYNFMLFTLQPLRLNFGVYKDKSLSIPLSKLSYLLLNERICPKLQMLYITIIPTLLNRKAINETLTNLDRFQSLSQLTIKVKSINFLVQYLKYFPVTLIYLKVVVIRNVQFYLKLKCLDIPRFSLKVLKFQLLTHSQTSLRVVNTLVSVNFRTSLKLNPSIIHVYQVLSQLLYMNRESMEYLELDMLNLNQVFLILSDMYHFAGPEFFPNLKLIKVDQTTNYPVFQVSTWLSNSGTIIYINNYLSNFVIIKNYGASQGIRESKFDMVLFHCKLSSIKKQLNLYYNK